MRLLEITSHGEFRLTLDLHDNIPPYAILSHTWAEGEEVTYDELVAGIGQNKAGYAKIRFCGERAAEDGLQYFWVDTCCINKSIRQELDTAIISMFRWYQRAKKCYVYLSDVQIPEEVIDIRSFRITWEDAFRRSRWFTRGWTLQELLAPSTVEFFSKEGKRLGSKISLEREVHEITKVPVGALRGEQRLSDFSISERMSWAANRKTTLIEDKVYCLQGIFGIIFQPLYGEGEEHAFRRLTKGIQEDSAGEARRHKVSAQNIPVAFNRFGENKCYSFWNCCHCRIGPFLAANNPCCSRCGHMYNNHCYTEHTTIVKEPDPDDSRNTIRTIGPSAWAAEFRAEYSGLNGRFQSPRMSVEQLGLPTQNRDVSAPNSDQKDTFPRTPSFLPHPHIVRVPTYSLRKGAIIDLLSSLLGQQDWTVSLEKDCLVLRVARKSTQRQLQQLFERLIENDSD